MSLTTKPRKIPRQARSQAMVETILSASARILVEKGYARLNTNLVAEAAEISVGSLYQYFPNKESLITALHQRHANQIQQLIEAVLSDLLKAPRTCLRDALSALVGAWMQAHLLEPELHRILEAELPFFDPHAPGDEDTAQRIFKTIGQLLQQHQAEISQPHFNLATYVVVKTIESLVHAVVIAPPTNLEITELQTAIVDTVLGFLTLNRTP